LSIKLNLVPLPPKEKALLCAHFKTKEEAFQANLIALKFNPGAVEMMDRNILDLTKENIEQRKNRFFVKDNPAAILIIEFERETKEEIEKLTFDLTEALKSAGFGYHYPIIYGSDINKVWALRKAGLGVLSNLPGDAKPVSLIEDCAIDVNVLPGYINEFEQLLNKYGKNCVYHAHIGSGELHTRPILNLKDKNDVELFYKIGKEVAYLVKKYKGSLSGEHGDGRLRGEFIPIILGEHNYNLLKKVKRTWDPDNIFNPGKITDTPSMKESLRFTPGEPVKEFKTYFDFSSDLGLIRAIEKCNGSADCRKSALIGGTMCPSYMATKDEHATTRARANLLREILTNSFDNNPFDDKELYKILDLCLSCKGCKSECPSNVDMAKLKAEFLQHYYDSHIIPLRTFMIANITKINKIASLFPFLANLLMNNFITSQILSIIGFAPSRRFPSIAKITVNKWFKNNISSDKIINNKVYLFNDEFTNYYDSTIGIKTIILLEKLGYQVIIPEHIESGRTYISKGLIKKAKKIANKNVSLLKDIINDNTPLIGIEPSTILSFRDEYPDLVDANLKDAAKNMAKNCLMIDEFIAKLYDEGKIDRSKFTTKKLLIGFHGHCQQKSVASTNATKKMLSIPVNYTVEEIKSGCCGMAGSFGYEKEHYDLSMKVGEMVLFPTIRNYSNDVVIAATGHSCRHHIKDGTGRDAYHPIEILYDAIVGL